MQSLKIDTSLDFNWITRAWRIVFDERALFYASEMFNPRVCELGIAMSSEQSAMSNLWTLQSSNRTRTKHNFMMLVKKAIKTRIPEASAPSLLCCPV